MSALLSLLAIPGIKTAIGLVLGLLGLVGAYFGVKIGATQAGKAEQKAADNQATTEAYQDAAQARRDTDAVPVGGAADQLQHNWTRDGQ